MTELRDSTPGVAVEVWERFESKEALALELFQHCYDWLAKAVSAPIRSRSYPVRMRIVALRYLKAMDDDLEAALFVQDNLRQLWSKLPKTPTRVSLIAHMRELVILGQQQKFVGPNYDPSLIVAALLGFVGQYARMLHFNEFAKPADQALDEFVALALTIGAARSGE